MSDTSQEAWDEMEERLQTVLTTENKSDGCVDKPLDNKALPAIIATTL